MSGVSQGSLGFVGWRGVLCTRILCSVLRGSYGVCLV